MPFHLSIRPQQQMIVRNSYIDGHFGEEELYLEGPFPFTLGTAWDMIMCIRSDGISVAINGQKAFEFAHRLQYFDPKKIDQLEMSGSQLITSIRYEFF